MRNPKSEFPAWLEAEKALTLGASPEDSRTSGLLAIRTRRWVASLLRLEEAARAGFYDLQLLDALGEAAYRAQMPESLVPFEHRYLQPKIATHMARAWMLMGDISKARGFLHLAEASPLKSAIEALLGIEISIEHAIESMISFAQTDPKLDYPDFWRALAPVAQACGRKDLVTLAERRCKENSHANPVMHYNQALRLLSEGELRAGWTMHEWRLVPGSQYPTPTMLSEISMWEGERLNEKSIVVVLESGFGDKIFGLRFINTLVDEQAKVSVVAPVELQELVKTSFPGLPVLLMEEAQKMKADYWCYSLSIPARAQIFAPVETQGYLSASENSVENCREILRTKNLKKLPVYGITWHGDVRTPAMRTRSYTVEEFLDHSGVLEKPAFIVSLQKDETPEEQSVLEDRIQKVGGRFLSVSETLKDFSQTAAWMTVLDEMFSCDTSTAHLVGALGINATILIRNKAIWHWRSTSNNRALWYDSVKIKYALVPQHSYLFDIRDA